MATEIKVPVLPESVSDATIASWHKKVGDAVARDENIVDLETDKVVLEVPAPVAGVLKEVKVQAGTTVTSDQLLAITEAREASSEVLGLTTCNSGVMAAPVGLLHEDGLRLRVMGGAGAYRYRTGNVPGGVNAAATVSAELMVGYRFSLAGTFITTYVGGHVENQSLATADPGHAAQGTEAGIKLALELYRRFTPRIFVTASASVSTVHDAHYARATVGYEFADTFALGIEAAVNGDARYDEPRAGVFVQSNLGSTGFTLAGGMLSNSDKGDGYYGTLSVHAIY